MTKRRKTSDGRVMTQPELRINEGSLSPDTIFTVSGTSPWGSTSKYNVVLNWPNSYYTYKAQQLETDENGDEVRSWVTKTGNDPQRLARYRSYVKEGEQANDYMSLFEDFLRLIGLKKKDGGWLTKFQNGGQTAQSISPEQDVMNTIDAAIGEMQTNRPGQAVQKLAAMMQDPNYSMIIDVIKQEYPQIEGVLNTVEQMIGAFKCGGKTKKKVKKGANGCVPCKKLMKIGGRLTNVLVDCEGNIIKHATGGWIRKGQIGLNTAGIVKDQFKQDNLSADNAANLQDRYFLKSDGTLGYQTWDSSAKSWKDGAFNIDHFNTWNESNNMFADGFVYDHTTNMGHFNGDEIKARAAMGQAYDNQEYIVSGNTVNGVTGASGHKALGTLGKDPTRRDALNQSGGLAKEINASLQQEADDLATVKNDWKTKRSTIWANGLQKGDLAALRESRRVRKAQSKGIKQAANADRLAWITEANKMASEKLGKQPEVTTPTVAPTKAKKVSVKTPPGDGTYTPRFAKQGGWLTKFN